MSQLTEHQKVVLTAAVTKYLNDCKPQTKGAERAQRLQTIIQSGSWRELADFYINEPKSTWLGTRLVSLYLRPVLCKLLEIPLPPSSRTSFGMRTTYSDHLDGIRREAARDQILHNELKLYIKPVSIEMTVF